MKIRVTKDRVYIEAYEGNLDVEESSVEWTIEEPDGFLADLDHKDAYIGFVKRIEVLRSLLRRNVLKR